MDLPLLIICAAAAGLLILFLFFNIHQNLPGSLATKPLLSLLFIIVAWRQPSAYPVYAGLLIGALSLCWFGDVCLVFQSANLFLAGLVFFLTAHLLYAAAYLYVAGPNGWSLIAAIVAVPGAWRAYRWLSPHLGAMKTPVLVYMAVISTMMIAAVTLAGDRRYALEGRLLILAGALAFYLSDIFVARQQFVTATSSNSLLGHPLYYTAQFLLAFSISRL